MLCPTSLSLHRCRLCPTWGVGNPTEVWIVHSTLQQHKITMNHKPPSYIHFFMVSTMSLPPPPPKKKKTDVLPLQLRFREGIPTLNFDGLRLQPFLERWAKGYSLHPGQTGNPLEKFSKKKMTGIQVAIATPNCGGFGKNELSFSVISKKST